MRKAQVTLFIILGIIIVFFFLMFFSFSQRLTKEQIRVINIARTELEGSAVNLYVSSCLENSFEQAVQELASNGGWIYEVSGCSADDCTLAGNINNISYGLTQHPDIEGTPKYPCIDTSYTWPFCKFYYDIDKPVLSIYGRIGIPKLQDEPNSIKDQLERYTGKKVLECIDFSRVQTLTGQPFDVNTEEADVNLDIRSEDIRVTLNLPVNINFQGKRVTEINTFSIAKNIRLNFLYKFINELLYNDNTNLGFDASTDFTNLTWYIGGMRLNVSYNVKGFDDIITITDNESRIDNKPLEFKIARQNLPPVLNYISGFSTLKYDYVVFENQTLIIEPQAFDPNEDNLIISYAGWKSNYDEIFTEAAGIVRVGIATPILERQGNKAIIRLTKTDLGPHNLTVFATDGQHTDYQVVRILVDDKVKLETAGRNPYIDIADEFASIEDPYFFQAITTDFFNPGENRYFWEDVTEQKILYQGNDESFWIPGPVNISVPFYEAIDINKVQNPFNEYPATHEIRAKVVSSSVGNITNEGTEVMSVLVRQCLAHRSDIPPYPYNEINSPYDRYGAISSDPFQGNHSCCIGTSQANWRIAGQETRCYKQTQYGAFSLFGISGAYPNAGDENDVYLRIFERTCDGLRGNMCLGAENENIQAYQRCSNLYAPNYCQGPARTDVLLPEPMNCINYTGASFTGRACNPELRCSNSVSYGASGNLLCKGGCDGAGGCTLPYQCIDADTDPKDKGCFKDNIFYSMDCNCVRKPGNDDIECVMKDLDDGQEWCDACSLTWINNICCGDDEDEFLIDNICCDNKDDCILNGVCYDDGQCINDNICINNNWEPKSEHPIRSLFC